MQIKKTKNYDMFGILDENRSLNKTQLNKLKRSIEQMNLLAAAPIIVDKHNNVLDGQHRLQVAKDLKLEIYYVAIDTKSKAESIKAVRLLNGSMKAWGIKDYVNLYVKLKIQDYVVLREFIDTFNISVTAGVYLLTAGKKAYKAGAGDSFKNGNFKATDVLYAYEIAEKYADIRKVFKHKYTSSRNFLYSVEKILNNPDYDHKHMMEKLKKHKALLDKQDSVNDYLRLFERVYNYGKHRNYVRFF